MAETRTRLRAAGPAGSRRAVGEAGVRALVRSRAGMAGLAVIAGLVICCFAGPLVYHVSQNASPSLASLPPGPGHPLGTDENGYDILGRLLAGGQSSLATGCAVAVLATAFGAAWGALAGFAGGVTDAVMMRVVDIGLAIPAVFVLVFLSSVRRPTPGLLIIVISLLSWLAPARLVRGEVLSLRTRGFVEAVTLMGGSRWRAVALHLIPNALPTIVVSATFQVADAIIVLATLSFLGFGLAPPAVSWGGILAQGITNLADGYWWQVYPAGLAIMITVLAFNLAGEALRDALDPSGQPDFTHG